LGNGRIAPGILNGSTRYRLEAILTPRPLYARKRLAIPTEERGHQKQPVYFEKKIFLAHLRNQELILSSSFASRILNITFIFFQNML